MGRRTQIGEFEGVRARRGRIEVYWPWADSPYGKGAKYGWATYEGNPTKTNKEAAFNLRKRIVRAIEDRTFRWQDFFPADARAIAEREEEERYQSEARARLVQQTIRNLLPGFIALKQQKDNFLGDPITPLIARQYENEVMFRLLPYLDMPIGTLTREMMEDHYKTHHGHLSDRKYNNSLAVMRGLWEYWIRVHQNDGINIFMLIKNRKVSKKGNPDPFKKTEMSRIIEHMREHYPPRIGNFYELSYLTGARPGELICVTSEDYDLDQRTLRIYKNRVGGLDQQRTKGGETASRLVHLTDRGIEIIQEQERLNTGVGFTNPHLFLTAYGEEYRWIGKLREDYWTPTLQALGIRERVAYKVRHTYASHRLMAGCLPAQVSHDLGHADLSMLFTVYGEYVNHGQSEAEMKKFEEFMEGVRAMPSEQQGVAMQALQSQLDMAKQTIEAQRQQLEMMQQMMLQQQQLMLMQKDVLPGEGTPEYWQNIGHPLQKKNPAH